MSFLLSIAIALVSGLMMTRVIKRFKFPAVTAYLIAGILVGPYCLGSFGIPGIGINSMDQLKSLEVISNVALGFIAFSIGNEFRLSQLKNNGRQATIVGIAQAVITTIIVDLGLFGLYLVLGDKFPLPVVITLGAIATATAPAATLMVVRQYKAKGPVTDILLPVVALDDAVGLVVFAISFGAAKAIISGAFDFIAIFVHPFLEIALSLLFGAVMGAILTFLERFYNSNSNRLSITIAIVILTVALSNQKIHIGSIEIGFSALLVCMMLGTMFCNLCPLSEDLMERADSWTAPLFALFFVLSGAGLELSVFTDIVVVGVGVAYILFRSLGKCFGSYVSTKASKCPENIVKYLGITLLPQAGVALGMCVSAQELGKYEGTLVRNIVLFAVLVYEIVGPLLTKIALTKAGEIKPKSEEVIRRREKKLKAAKGYGKS